MSPIIFLSFGIPGNLMIIYILLQKKFIDISSFRYLLVSSFVDIGTLVLAFANYNPQYFSYLHERIACKTFTYTISLVPQISAWIASLCSFDRLLTVKYSMTSQFRNKLVYQVIAISIIFAVLMVANVPYIMFYDIITWRNYSFCAVVTAEQSIIADVIYNTFLTIIPFFIMVITTWMILYHFMVQNKKLKNDKKYKKDVAFTKVIFAINLWFLVCNLPYAIVQLTADFARFQLTDYLRAVVLLCFSCTSFLTYSYPAFNFFVYFFSNRLFREHFYSLLKLKRNKRFSNSSTIHNKTKA